MNVIKITLAQSCDQQRTLNGIGSNQRVTNLEIHDTEITQVDRTGIAVVTDGKEKNENCSVERNVVKQFSTFGIRLGNCSQSQVNNNEIRDGSSPTSGPGILIEAKRSEDTDSRLMIESVDAVDNTIKNLAHDGVEIIAWNANEGAKEVELKDVTVSENEVSKTRDAIKLSVRGDHSVASIWEISGCNLEKNEQRGILIADEGDEISDVQVDDCLLTDNKHGITTRGTESGSISVRNSRLTNNSDIGFQILNGSATPFSVNQNDIVDNGQGAVNDGSSTLDAENNWWGAENGPEREVGRSGRTVGDGDAVSGNIDFRPWLNSSVN